MSCLYRDYRRVEGYEDYIVSNYGEVFSTKRINGTYWRKLSIIKSVYPQVVLSMGKAKTFTIHVLVGNAFIGKRTNGLEFDHIDRNKTNNRADNLRLATRSEQSINTRLNKRNKLKERNISIANRNNGHSYYRIEIKRDKKMVFNKWLNIKDYTLEYAIKVRDDFLTTSAMC